jgi:hypothetical protein
MARNLDRQTERTVAQEAQKKPVPLARFMTWPPAGDEEREERSDLPDVSGDDSEDRKAGQHWGGFWPEEQIPEWDEICFEPIDGDAPTVRLPPPEPSVPKRGDFRVYSSRGVILGRFSDRWRARGALNRWHQADFVLCGDRVVFRKRDAAIHIGDVAAEEATGLARAA